jgi:hypothetical protein
MMTEYACDNIPGFGGNRYPSNLHTREHEAMMLPKLELS